MRGTAIPPVINTVAVAQYFAEFPHRRLLDMLVNGVRFQADLPLQHVMAPNLHSLYAENGGIEAAASQMRAMASEGWLGMFGSVIPSCPFRCIPRGEVPKKGSVELRGIADQGQPRKRLRTQRSREPVPALNDVAREGEWDHEDKDTVQAAVLNGLIVQALADLNNEPVIDIALDWSKWFHRAWYNAYELWLAGALVPDAVKGSLLAFAIEYVLSMGATPSSQIMQRLATAMTAKLCAEFDELERARAPRRARIRIGTGPVGFDDQTLCENQTLNNWAPALIFTLDQTRAVLAER